MSFLDQIRDKKSKLSHTETTIKTVSGDILQENRTETGVILNKISSGSSGYVVDTKPDLQVAQITPNLCLGSQDVTQDLDLLNKYKITHVLSIGIQVPKMNDIDYTFIEALDLPEFKITDIFDEAFKIIDQVTVMDCVVLVHCNAGISRSASVVIGYLMKNKNMTLEEALVYVKERRSVAKPNEGFMEQLKLYENSFDIRGTKI